MSHILKTQVYDSPNSFIIRIGQTVQFIPLNHMSVHDELDLKGAPEVSFKLF